MQSLAPSIDLRPPLTRHDFLTCAAPAENPRADSIERRSTALALRLGLVRADNLAHFQAFNIIGRYVYPHADLARGLVCAMWCNWLYFFDDIHDEQLAPRHDSAAVHTTIARVLDLLASLDLAADPRDPLERLIDAFRRGAVELAGHEFLARFVASTRDYLARGVLLAVDNWGRAHTPPLDEYLAQREHDSAVMTALDLIELANDLRLDRAVLGDPDLQRARRAATLAVALFNDIVSFPKEVLRHHNPNNLVHVLMQRQGLPLAAAAREAARITNDHADQLTRSAAAVAATYPEGHPVQIYVRGLREWQRGNIDFSLVSPRYAAAWSPLAELALDRPLRAR